MTMRTVGWYMGARVEVLGSVPEWVESTYLNGLADQSGDMSGPGGHLYRVDEYLVRTDENGSTHPMRVLDAPATRSFPAEDSMREAERAMEKHREYVATAGTYAGL